MKFLKARLYNADVNVVFTGKEYAFFNDFYGILCVAERDYDFQYAEENKGKVRFRLNLDMSRDRNNIADDVLRMVSKVINKVEKQFIVTKEVYYEIVDIPSYNWGITLKIDKKQD